MRSDSLELLLIHKFLVVFSSRFLIISAIFVMPIVMIISLNGDNLSQFDIEYIYLNVILTGIFILLWLIDSYKKLSIVTGFYIDSAKKISEIRLPSPGDKTRKLMLILTLKLNDSSSEKRFFFVRKSLLEADFVYKVLVSVDNPDKYIILSSLPKTVQKYLENS